MSLKDQGITVTFKVYLCSLSLMFVFDICGDGRVWMQICKSSYKLRAVFSVRVVCALFYLWGLFRVRG